MIKGIIPEASMVEYKCYICNQITENHKLSDEHIIPNCIGGVLKSNKLLCSTHNNELGATIDAILSAQLSDFADLLGIQKDGIQKKIRIPVISESGKEIVIGEKLIPKYKITLPNGNVQFIDHEKKEEYLNKIIPQFEKLYDKKIVLEEYIEPTTNEIFYIKNKNNSNVINGSKRYFGGVEYYRAIAKIAVNYYLYKGYDNKWCLNAIDFIRNGNSKGKIVKEYHPSPIHYRIHDLEAQEVSHIIKIIGSPSEKMLIVYVELFNFQNFIVLLDNNYLGEEIEETYCYDLINSRTITKEVIIKLKKHHFDILDIDYKSTGYKIANKKFNRLEQIITDRQLL